LNYQKVGVNLIEAVTDLDAIIASRDTPVLDLHVGRRVGELALRVRPEVKVVKLFFSFGSHEWENIFRPI
jgi:hypothetical protein